MAVNWKRPWAEEEDLPYTPRDAIFSNENTYRGEMSESGSSGASRRPSAASDSNSTAPQSFPSSQTSIDSRLSEQRPQRYDASTDVAKRPRLDLVDRPDEHARPLWSERAFSGSREKIELPAPSAALSEKGGYGNTHLRNIAKDAVLSPPVFHGDGHSTHFASTPKAPVSADHASRSCKTCKAVDSSIPRLADGLNRLQADLRAVLSTKEGDSKALNIPRPTGPAPEGILQSLDWSLNRLTESIDITRELLSASTAAGDKSRLVDDYGAKFPRGSPSASEENARPPPQSPSAATYGSKNNPPLPSPVSVSFPTALPPSPSAPQSSPHTAHLQELRHQLSTKTLAHQILTGEHDKLIAAYSRLKTRCATLDKKSAVSESEINSLYEEKSRLQNELDIANDSIEELEKKTKSSLETAEKDSCQFLKIMNQSSMLQAKSAAEQKRWKADREQWMQEKAALLAKIDKFESGSGSGSGSGSELQADENQGVADEDFPETFEALKKEVARLRTKVKAGDEKLQAHEEAAEKLSAFSRELEILGLKLRG